MNNKKFQALTSAILAFILTIYAVGVITLLLGSKIGAVSGIVGFACGLCAAWLILLRNHRLKAIVFLISFYLCSSLLAAWFFDTSWDGWMYHKPAVIQFLAGWNPYVVFVSAEPVNFWTAVYPKASWVLAAQTVAITGLLETGKVFNCLAILVAFLSAWRFLERKMPGRPKLALLAASLIGLNPVSAYQALTFYVDGLLASFFTVLLFALAEILDRPKEKNLWFEASVAAILLVNLKFSGMVYALILLGCFWVAMIFRGGKRALSMTTFFCMSVAFLSIFVFGKTPFMDNMLRKRPIFYPLMGKEKIDVVSNFTPSNLADTNRFFRWALSNASHSHSVYPPDRVQLRWPFDISKVGHHWVDTNVGGFGPLFGESVLFCSIILGFAFRFLTLPSLASLFVLGSVLITTFIHKEAWWARYAPQIFLIPVLAACYLQKSNKPWIRNGGVVVLTLLLLNLLVVAALSTGTKAWGNILWRQGIAQIKEKSTGAIVEIDFGEHGALKRQLRETGLQFTESKKDGSADWKPMPIFKKCFWRPSPQK